MAARPLQRHVLRCITQMGGFDRLEERIASGETVADLAREILRPDGVPISRNFLSLLLHHDPVRSARLKALRPEQAAAMVDHALHLVDHAPLDREGINKAKVQSDLRLKVAGFLDRQQWGEKQAVNVQVNVAELHLDALRHRQISSTTTGLPELTAGQQAGDGSASNTALVENGSHE